jgi:hypothetical protein
VNIIEGYTKDGYIQLFEKEIQEDKARITKFEAVQRSMTQRAQEEQATY